MSHYRDNLVREVLARSQATEWQVALKEWDAEHAWNEEDGTCTCGYHPITQRSLIRNRLTGKSLIIGRVCVKNFLKFTEIEDAFKVFQAIRELEAGDRKRVPICVIDAADNAGVLRSRESSFLRSISKKRKLSWKQGSWNDALVSRLISQINGKVMQLNTNSGGKD